MDEHLAEAEEEDVGEREGDTYTYVPTDTASSLLGRKSDTHDGQDESREWQSETGVLLDQGELHVCISTHLLRCDHIIKFLIIKGLHCLFRHIEVLDRQCKGRIHLTSAADVVSEVVIILSDEIFFQTPCTLKGIIHGCLS